MGKTGWPAGLLQDDSRGLSDWFASRVDAKHTVRNVCAEIERNRTMSMRCIRCGRTDHMVEYCKLPVLPDNRVLSPAPAPAEKSAQEKSK
jgi:hypothetical protein